MLASSKSVGSDDALEVPIGYKMTRKGVTLEVKEFSHDRLWCHCSACGYVIPVLDSYTKEKLESWFDFHIALFAREHENVGEMANETHIKKCFNCSKKIQQPVLYKGYVFCSEKCKEDFINKQKVS
jgi:predicted nucleic acid-binding Zn ribbon protein